MIIRTMLLTVYLSITITNADSQFVTGVTATMSAYKFGRPHGHNTWITYDVVFVSLGILTCVRGKPEKLPLLKQDIEWLRILSSC